jgi:hypothetical protein
MNKYFTIRLIFIQIILCFVSPLLSQIGSRYTYEFLSLPTSARMTALGGVGVLDMDDDINMASANPSLLNNKMNKSIAFNHNYHFADIANGHVAIGKSFGKFNTLVAFTYANFGDFKLTDEFDNDLGTFGASDRALTIGVGRKLNERISVGVNLKGLFSNIETYQSIGIATDLALSYHNPDKEIVYSFLVKNLGSEVASYNDSKLSTPLDIQLGFSKKLTHLPLRFSIIGHQLQQWNVRYDDPDDKGVVDFFGEEEEQSEFTKSVDNIFRHLIFNAELSLGKSKGFKVRGGYNHFRRRELNLSSIRSLAGFSLGFGLKIKKINFEYGLGYYHLAGATNHISIMTNLDRFVKKVVE